MRTPFGILERVQPARGGLSLAPLALAAAALALAMSLAFPLAQYPGIPIGFDSRAFVAREIQAPATPAADLARTGAVATLVSARGASTYVVEGRIIQGRDALLAELRRVAANPTRRELPILVRADRTQTMQGLADVLTAARTAGFPGILIAADPR